MIRKFLSEDMDAVLDIWLSASLKAHDFVEANFWRSQLQNMRDIYIPASEVYIYEDKSEVLGFVALLDDRLAAIFVKPDKQGEGIGKALVEHAKTIRKTLTLSVYKANIASIHFYKSQGFFIIEESLDSATGQEEYVMRFPS